MRSCHTMVKSAVLPKTTSLCTSITVYSMLGPHHWPSLRSVLYIDIIDANLDIIDANLNIFYANLL